MANSGIYVVANGTETTDGTEQDLLDSTVVASFSGWISLANMVSGDALTIRQYEHIESTKTLYKANTYGGVQSEPAVYFSPKVSASRIIISIEQTAGTYRNYSYEFDAETSLAQADIISDSTPFSGADIAIIKQIESGRWKIINNQMIFYDTDDSTPLLTFNLKNRGGTPTDVNVYERTPA